MFNKILYHADCHDGLTAAFLAQRANPDAVIIRVKYQQPPPEGLTVTDRVLIVDFSYPRAVLEEMKGKVAELLVLDHHKTAEAELAGLDYCRFEGGECGATMTYAHVNGHTNWGKGLAMIRDRDLWTKRWPDDTEAFTAGLGITDHTRDEWLHAVLNNWQNTIDIGRPIVKYQKKLRERMVAECDWSDKFGALVPCVNTNVLMSDIGNDLLEAHPTAPFSMIWFQAGGRIKYSLRGANRKFEDGSDVDCSALAKKYGGGGHKNAAGFDVPVAASQYVATELTNNPDKHNLGPITLSLELARTASRDSDGCLQKGG